MNKSIIIFILSLLFIFPANAGTGEDKTDRLIQLLIKKNIITDDEARAIVEELEEGDVKDAGRSMAETEKKSSDWTDKIEVKYDNGAVIKTADKNYSVKLRARYHGLFLYEDPDNGTSYSTFRTRRARILVDGNAMYPWLKYAMQMTLEGSGVALRDAYIEASYYKWLTPRLGQYKVPFDREFLDSGFSLQLIDRSIASSEFSIQRDIGLQVSGKRIFGVFDYSAGMFNGSGVNRNNVDNDYIYVGRIVWSPAGSYPYWESAVDNPSSPQYALAIAGAYMPELDPGERAAIAGRLGSTSIMPVESDVTQWTVDFAFKYQGFSMMSGYHYRNIDPGTPVLFGEQDAWGFYLQGGYFIVPKHFEIAGRYAYVEPDNPVSINYNEEREITLGVNYYFNSHKIKTGLNYSLFTTEAASGDEDEHAVKGSIVLQF